MILGLELSSSMIKMDTNYLAIIDTIHWKEYGSAYAVLTLLSLIGFLPITNTIIILIMITTV